MTDLAHDEPDTRLHTLAAALAGLAADRRGLLLGIAGGPRSGVLRVSRTANPEFEARLTAAYRRHYDSLVSYARRHGITGPAAEDVVQQAFENVWQRRLRPTEITNVDAYVQTAVRHETFRALRRARDDRERYAGDPADCAPGRDGGPADHVADRVTLHRFLGRLPAREREAVVLRMVWDLSVREAAETMGLSEGAVKRYCSDGLHRLNAWLGAA